MSKIPDRPNSKNDPDALYRECFPSLVRLAYVMMDSPSEAEDVVHDSFVRALPKLDHVANPAAYLRAAVVNNCKNRYRRRRLIPWSQSRLDAHSSFVEVSTQELQFAEALRKLSAKRRAVLALRYLEDASDEEIARLLGCTQSTVRSLIKRARDQIIEEML